MNVLIFGGTTEGRELSAALADAGALVTVCVLSDYGRELQEEHRNIRTLTGPLSDEEKDALLSQAELCVDATHPYARHITASVKAACRRTGTEYLRLLREESDIGEAHVFDSAEEAAAFLKGQEGNILLTTGSKDLSSYREIAPARLFPRILPSHQSLSSCEEAGIPHKNIIAMQGPFSQELNEALIRQYRIRYLVTKDGGSPGGFDEKAMAARQTGAALIVLRRPGEEGETYGNVLALCLKKLAIDSQNKGMIS